MKEDFEREPKKSLKSKIEKLHPVKFFILLVILITIVVTIGYYLVGHYEYEWAKINKREVQEKVETKQEVLKELQEVVQMKKSSQIKKTIQELQPKLDPEITEKITGSIIKNAKEYNIPESLIIAIINRESSFNPIAVSKANCIGLMQINPKAHKELLDKMGLDYYSACYIDNNIKLGCIIFSEYFKEKETLKDALKRYLGASSNKYYQDILELFTQIEMEKLKNTEGGNEKSEEPNNEE